MQLPNSMQRFSVARAVASCRRNVLPGGQCGGPGGAEAGACCPDGFSCQPSSPGGAGSYPHTESYAQADAVQGAVAESYTCQVDPSAQPLASVAAAAAAVPYPVPQLPLDACACRVDNMNKRVPAACPSPWDHPAGTSQVPPALTVGPKGGLSLAATNEPAQLRGINWFGWEGGQHNPDGLWAYCDDNSTSCSAKDGEVPPYDFPSAAIGEASQNLLQIYFWKRRLSNDFATVAWRHRLLGFNAIRLPFTFSALADDLADYSEFFACVNDPEDYIVRSKTLDPLMADLAASAAIPASMQYVGVPHPPQPASGQPSECSRPWSVPFLDSYQSLAAREEFGSNLSLTMCNWYLPQGAGALGIHRFLWQVQYLVSQGFYVVLDYHPTNNAGDPNMQDPELFATNWGNLWRAIQELPNYSCCLAGRIIADLVNEASRYKCQWDSACGSSCARGSDLIGRAVGAIRAVDSSALISYNGMGQDGSGGCAGTYPGMNWGDGFITDVATLAAYNLSDPSFLMNYSASDESARQRLLAPHTYPVSITGWGPQYDTKAAVQARWGLSWGKKAKGLDRLSNKTKAPRAAVMLGEFGAKDDGDNSVANDDTTAWSASDAAWFKTLAAYARKQMGPKPSWLFWAWNANSGDTRGVVGPQTTWRQVQWTKVRLLAREFGLRPWFCDAVAPSAAKKVYGCK